ncbi:MAG: DUF72 domain-containing protein [Candidatus Zixiibacteriota bacterium]|nr:MAG: DUF72 domain-containing protein [candidate division Zixibacteria bacterium]
MSSAVATIEVGTSGFSFKDWIGPFYPPGTPAGRLLEYYARHFPVVEINTTYYGIPKAKTFEGMAEQVPEDFGFYLKVHQEVTHGRENPEASITQLYEAAAPLKERGLLRGFLAQFPYSFHRDPDNRRYLARLADLWGEREPLFVEFRHASWLRPEVYQALEERGLGYVNVDLPALGQLPGPSAVVTNGTGYFRFHGRNAEHWWEGDGQKRYDYDYSTGELQEWMARLRPAVEKAGRVIIFMNNCFLGQAARNARMLQDLFAELA